MLLRRNKKAAPTEPRTGLQQAASAGAAPGQRILAYLVAIGATLVIFGGVAYAYVWPAMKGNAAQPAAGQEPIKEEKQDAPKLNVKLDLDAADPAPVAVEQGGGVFQNPPGLNVDSYPSAQPAKAGQPQIGTRTAPPGLNQQSAEYSQGHQEGDPDQEKEQADRRKLAGDLGDFGDKSTVKSARRQAAQSQQDLDADDDDEAAEAAALQRDIARRRAAAGLGPNTQQGSSSTPAIIGGGQAPQNANSGASNALAAQLIPIATPNGEVRRIPNPHLTIQKGQPATCTLDTAIQTDQLGFVECITDYPLWSMDGKVVLAERGTRIQGEYSRSLAAGSGGIFVLWTKGVTPAPNNVEFSLLSPGTDKLGRAGIQGDVDNKFWQRYGGALMFSVLQDVSSIATTKAQSGGTPSVLLLPGTQSAGQAAIAELLKQGAEIKPSLYRNQGDTVSITIARYIDFSNVYRLKPSKVR